MSYTERDVFSTGEVVVRAWSNGETSGYPVLVCNGLGAGATCWPELYDRDTTGFHVVGFNHRGTAGSGRPLQEGETYVPHHAEDALAVMTAFDMQNPLLLGWGVGVSVAFEAAHMVPDLVTGILAVCGVPDTSTGAVGYPLAVPSRVGRSVTTGALSAVGSLPTPLRDLVRHLPVNDTTVGILQSTGLLSARAAPQVVSRALGHYLEHDLQWYAQLARSATEHGQVDTNNVSCPSRFLAARGDVFLSPAVVREAARRLPDATVDVVDGSHFLPLERPDLILAELRALHTAPTAD